MAFSKSIAHLGTLFTCMSHMMVNIVSWCPPMLSMYLETLFLIETNWNVENLFIYGLGQNLFLFYKWNMF